MVYGKVKKRFEIALDIKRSSSNREFEVVEGDNGNELIITLTDGGEVVELSGCMVCAVFSKSDGATAMQDNQGNGVTTDENNRLIIDLYPTSFAPGMVECEIQVYSGEEGNTLATSAKFNFKCRRGIFNKDTIMSTEEYPLLARTLMQAEELVRALNAGLEALGAVVYVAHAQINEKGSLVLTMTDGSIADLGNVVGDPGVYVGSGPMPESCSIQIDPAGQSELMEELKEYLAYLVQNVEGLAGVYAPAEHEHDAGEIASGALGVPRGGTGLSLLAEGCFLKGNGDASVALETAGTARASMGLGEGTEALQIPYGGTGAITAEDALISLGAAKLIHKHHADDAGAPTLLNNRADIPNGANIDAYRTAGSFLVASASIAASLRGGAPWTNGGFLLYVLYTTSTIAYPAQIAIQNVTGAAAYRRWDNASSSWGAWTYYLDSRSIKLKSGTCTLSGYGPVSLRIGDAGFRSAPAIFILPRNRIETGFFAEAFGFTEGQIQLRVKNDLQCQGVLCDYIAIGE